MFSDILCDYLFSDILCDYVFSDILFYYVPKINSNVAYIRLSYFY